MILKIGHIGLADPYSSSKWHNKGWEGNVYKKVRKHLLLSRVFIYHTVNNTWSTMACQVFSLVHFLTRQSYKPVSPPNLQHFLYYWGCCKVGDITFFLSKSVPYYTHNILRFGSSNCQQFDQLDNRWCSIVQPTIFTTNNIENTEGLLLFGISDFFESTRGPD